LFRWRCYRRACGRDTFGKKAHRRKSTKRKLAPKCPGCGHEMRLDLRRTTGEEKRKHNCHCGGPRFEPHQRNYCQRLKVREYEESRVPDNTSVAEAPF
jgi:hypothetical protein